MRKFFVFAVAVYLFLCLVASALYNFIPSRSWDIATNRNGLCIVSAFNGKLHMLNPLNNYGDDWI